MTSLNAPLGPVQITQLKPLPETVPRSAFYLFFVLSVFAGGPLRASGLDADDDAIFFPVAAAQRDDGRWEAPLRGWVFEKKQNLALERVLLSGFRKTLRLPESANENAYFRERGPRFVVDNERGKRLTIKLNNETYRLSPSNDAGRLSDSLTFAGSGSSVTFRTDDSHSISGVIHLLPSKGLSIVSDIDDTIKLSEVLNRPRLLARTFLEPYEAVPGMAEIYSQWQKSGASFHYVSGSPSPLFPALLEFLQNAGFPEGTINLRLFRPKSRELLILKEPSISYKKAVIEDLLKRFPERQFILVGDSGEHDPEIYGDLARRYLRQIRFIAIRQVRSEESTERFVHAFRRLPLDRWTLFQTPADVPARAAASGRLEAQN